MLWDCPQCYIAKPLVVCPVSSSQPNTRKAASTKVHPAPPPRCPLPCLASLPVHLFDISVQPPPLFPGLLIFFSVPSHWYLNIPLTNGEKKKENPSLNPISTSGCPLSLISLSQPNSPKSCLHRCFHSSPPFRSSTPSRQPAPNHPNGPNGSR